VKESLKFSNNQSVDKKTTYLLYNGSTSVIKKASKIMRRKLKK